MHPSFTGWSKINEKCKQVTEENSETELFTGADKWKVEKYSELTDGGQPRSSQQKKQAPKSHKINCLLNEL